MKTKKLAISAVCAALTVILLAVGSIITTLDIALSITASVIIFALMLDYDKRAAFAVFLVAACLSLLILPQKTPAFMYALFFGWYPFIKNMYEHLPIVLSWALKVITFNVAVVLYYVVARFILQISVNLDFILILSLILANFVFVLYDICCTRFVVFYVRVLSPRLARIIK